MKVNKFENGIDVELATSHSPGDWPMAFAVAETYIRCSKECIGGSQDISPDVEHLSTQGLSTIPTTAKDQTVTSPPDHDHNGSSSPASDTASPISGKGIMQLPRDVFMLIFEAVTEPHVLIGRTQCNLVYNPIARDFGCYTQLVLYEPRRWCDINVFHINRAFRSLALKHYGKPTQNALPFNPVLDSLKIEPETTDCDNPFAVPGLDTRLGQNPYHLSAQDEACRISEELDEECDLHDLMEFKRSPGIFSCYLRARKHPYLIPPTRMSSRFLARIERVQLDIGAPTIYGVRQARSIATMLGEYLPRMRHLTFATWHFDCCAYEAEIDREDELDTNDIYRVQDLVAIATFCQTGPTTFPSLQGIRVIRTHTVCSNEVQVDEVEDGIGGQCLIPFEKEVRVTIAFTDIGFKS